MVEASATIATIYVPSERGMVVVECNGECEWRLSRRGHRHLKLLGGFRLPSSPVTAGDFLPTLLLAARHNFVHD